MSDTVLKVGDDSVGKELYYTSFAHFQLDRNVPFCHDEEVLWPREQAVEKQDVDPLVFNPLTEDDVPVAGDNNLSYLLPSQKIALTKPLQDYNQNPIFLKYFIFYDGDGNLTQAIYTDIQSYLMSDSGETVQYF